MMHNNVEIPTNGGVLEKCPVCGGSFEPVYLNQYTRLISRCLSCEHHFVVNPWTEKELAEFYKGFGYFTQNCKHQGIRSISQDEEWKAWVGRRIALLERLCLCHLPQKPLMILEQGCLEGRVLDGFARLGHHVVGCDVNAHVTNAGRNCFNIDLRAGTIESSNLKPNEFDLLYSFHTLEHLYDPVRNLVVSKSLLKPGGVLFFEIPINEKDYDNRDHLHFFSKKSLHLAMKAIFNNYETEDNSFTTEAGVRIESIRVVAIKKR